MKKLILPVLAVCLGTIGFVPVGLFLQWWLPQDGPGELIVLLLITPFLALSVVLLKLSRKGGMWRQLVLQFLGSAFLVFFVWVSVFTFFPALSRRVGPWHTIRTMLVSAAQEIEAQRDELGVPPHRPLTTAEFEALKTQAHFVRSEYTFPLINRTVRLRWISTEYPYVGLNYGGGRNCLFDLESMRCQYAD